MTAIASGKSVPERIYQGLSMGGGNRVALVVNGRRYSYKELKNAAFSFAAAVKDCAPYRLGLFTRGSFETYQSLLGSLLSGTTVVPLNPKFPAIKNAFIMEHSACSHVFIDHGCIEQAVDSALNHMNERSVQSITFLAQPQTANDLKMKLDMLVEDGQADAARVQILASRITEIIADSDADSALSQNTDLVRPESPESSAILHILYTSGTTGEPKGVVVTQGNYAAYLDKILDLYQFRSDDVFSHFAEITFDISLQDLLCSIISGGTLVCPSERDRIVPHKYLADNAVTILHASPSLISYMHRIRVVNRTKLPCLRMAVFIGEALWFHQLRQFHNMAPDARLFNTYGPTETTVAVSSYESLPFELDDDAREYSIVPLGRAFTGVEMMVVDEQLNQVPEGKAGELLIGGDQVTAGYWSNEAKNNNAFIELNGCRWYRTGDIVKARRSVVTADCLHGRSGDSYICYYYLGRNDDMVKVRSYRISLYEVEEKLAMLTDHAVAVLACSEPYDGLDLTVIAAMIEGGSDDDIDSIKTRIADVLPDYMKPRYMLCVNEFPLNTNGKVDRRALKDMLLSAAQEKFKVTLKP